MSLHPIAQTILAEINAHEPLERLSVEGARNEMAEFAKRLGAGEAVAQVVDRLIPGPVTDIPVRLYTPPGQGPLPLFVYYHAGGWVLGNLDTDDVFCRAIANAASCIVVSVNYRHAPEHKFPAAVQDAYAAASWVAEHASGFGGDASRLAVGGTSAGGNLAAVVVLMAREHRRPGIIYQVLIVPVTNYDFDTRSYIENGEGYGLTRSAMRWFWQHYLTSEADGANPNASPLRVPDLSDLPPAFVMTAEYDPLRDEGQAYAERLRDAGVSVDYCCYDGMIHMFRGPESDTDIVTRLRAAFDSNAGRRSAF